MFCLAYAILRQHARDPDVWLAGLIRKLRIERLRGSQRYAQSFVFGA
jgi:hypothetical protein